VFAMNKKSKIYRNPLTNQIVYKNARTNKITYGTDWDYGRSLKKLKKKKEKKDGNKNN
jgi:hypothetical protein